MRSWLSAFLVVLLTVAGLAGCQTSVSSGRIAGGTVPILDADSARAAGLSLQEVGGAAKLYTAKCARCHKFYDPAVYSDPEWRSWMKKMSKKARLKSDQEQLLSRYLEAFREQRKPAGESPK